jgi:hypothetical protein
MYVVCCDTAHLQLLHSPAGVGGGPFVEEVLAKVEPATSQHTMQKGAAGDPRNIMRVRAKTKSLWMPTRILGK